MGCLFVLILAGASAAMISIFGYPLWVMVVLGLLWLAALVVSALAGHHGFGGRGNTDLQFVIAGVIIAAVIIIPSYAARQPCNQAKTALRKLAEAENKYFLDHNTFTTEVHSLNLTPNPDVSVVIIKGDEKSFTATASLRLCVEQKNGTPKVLVWDSARGGLQ